MSHPIPLRSDFTASEPRQLAQRSEDAGQAQRLLALAAIYDGGTRSEAARLGNVTVQVVRDWVRRFNCRSLDLIERLLSPGRDRNAFEVHRPIAVRIA